MKSIETRKHLLECTLRLLLQKGFDGVSISDIQEETGISRGLLYHYYPDKESLFMAVGHQYFVDLYSIDLGETEGFGMDEMISYMVEKYRKIIDEVGRVMFDEGLGHSDFLFYRLMQEDPSFAKKYASQRRKEQKAWESALVKSLREGSIRSDISIPEISRQWVYLLDGLWTQRMLEPHSRGMLWALRNTLRSFADLLRPYPAQEVSILPCR